MIIILFFNGGLVTLRLLPISSPNIDVLCIINATMWSRHLTVTPPIMSWTV
jgi:hypothetical protein